MKPATAARALAAIAVGALALWLVVASRIDPEIVFLPAHAGADWIVYPSPAERRIRPVVELDAVFARAFTLDVVPSSAPLTLRAFQRVDLTLNGQALPWNGPSNWKEPTTLDVAGWLRPGANELRVTVRAERGPPALWLKLTTGVAVVASDPSFSVSLAGATQLPARRASDAARPARDGELRPQPWPALAGRPGTLALWILIGAACVAGLYRWPRRPPALFACVGFAGLLWTALFVNNLPSLRRTDGFDAAGHLAYIQYLLDHHRIPGPDDGWTMYHPPLYPIAAAAALATCGLDTQAPSAPTVLRLLSLTFGWALLIFTALALRRLFPENPRAVLLGVAFAALVPAHLYIFQFPTNESLAAVLSVAAVWAALGLLGRARVDGWRAAGVGLWLGAAMLTKFTTILVVAAVGVALVWKLASERRGIAESVRAVAALAGACVAVCGWRFAGIWLKYGQPFVSNWAPEISVDWWQDPGYQTAGYFVRGGLFADPFYSGLRSFVVGIYTTLWADGLLAGCVDLASAPPWNHDLASAGFILALLPTAILLLGAAIGLRRFLRAPTPDLVLICALAAASAALLVYVAVRVPSYSMAKAFYAFPAFVCLAVFFAWGMDAILRRGKLVGGVVATLVLASAGWGASVFWIPRGSARAELRLGRALVGNAKFVDEAERRLRIVLEEDSGDEAARVALARAYLTRGRSGEAEALLRALVLEAPDVVEAQVLLAPMLRARGAVDEAAVLLVRALARAPDHEGAWTALARLEAERGRFVEAAVALREAVRVRPADAAHQLQLVAILEAAGDRAGTVAARDRAMRIDPRVAQLGR